MASSTDVGVTGNKSIMSGFVKCIVFLWIFLPGWLMCLLLTLF